MAGNTVDWGSTSDALSTLLGFDETEDWDDEEENYLIGSSPHTHGWYPGTISFGESSGAGHSGESDWVPDWPESRSVSGSGSLRRLAPVRARWLRTIGWDLLTDAELLDVDRGVHALCRAWALPIRYYPDRSIGTVATPGTQADPQDDPDDANADYWLVWLDEMPAWQLHAQSGAYRAIELRLHGEPD